MSMKFSIVITTYNRLNLLKRAVDSALKQTISCEIVVIDDCSTDATIDYLQALSLTLQTSDKKLIYHRNDINLGHSGSVNLGVELASGEWIKLVDDDDYLAPQCLAQISRAIAPYPQAVICSSQAVQVDEQQQELSITRKVGFGELFYIPQADIHYGMLLELVPFGTPVQVAFRRDAFLRSGGWNSCLDTNFDDIDSWVKIAQFGDAVFVNQVLAYRAIWSGAYNQKFSWQQRLETNILIKKNIYNCVHQKYDKKLPPFTDVEKYLRLHWGLQSMKRENFFLALRNIPLSLLSPTACQILLHRHKKNNPYYNSLLKKQYIYSNNPYKNVKLTESSCELAKKYIQLRWGLKAWRDRKFSLFAKNAFSALLNPLARKLLFSLIKSDFTQSEIISPSNNNNVFAIKKIHDSIITKHHTSLPHRYPLKTYLQLGMLIAAWRERKIFKVIKLTVTTMSSPLAWKLLGKVIRVSINQHKEPWMRRVLIVE